MYCCYLTVHKFFNILYFMVHFNAKKMVYIVTTSSLSQSLKPPTKVRSSCKKNPYIKPICSYCSNGWSPEYMFTHKCKTGIQLCCYSDIIGLSKGVCSTIFNWFCPMNAEPDTRQITVVQIRCTCCQLLFDYFLPNTWELETKYIEIKMLYK